MGIQFACECVVFKIVIRLVSVAVTIKKIGSGV